MQILSYIFDAKNWLIVKDLDDEKDWKREEKGTTGEEMVEWHRWLNEHELEWTPGIGDGQGGLVCCSPWGRKGSDTTEQLNWTELNWTELQLKKSPCNSEDPAKLKIND